ncbi:MAG: hypothetical protein RLZZ546_514, partial [Bacteroidota bacterium]
MLADLKEAKTPFEKKAAQKAFNQFGRWQYQWKDYVGADGRLPKKMAEFELLRLSPNQLLDEKNNTNRSGNWASVGPNQNVNKHGYDAYPGVGRINVVRQLSSNTILVGTPYGGIWKTTDGGGTWTPKTGLLARSGISDIRINPNNPSIIYAITGDRDGMNCASIGVIRSEDAGETWSTTGLVISPEISDGFSNSSLGMNPEQSNNLVVSVNKKVYYSNNSGATFTLSNIEIPMANDILYEKDFVLISSNDGHIYKSSNNGQTFENIYETSDTSIIRFNQRVVHGYVYFFKAIENAGVAFRVSVADVLAASATNPISPTQLGQAIGDFNPQGFYNTSFAVNPTDQNAFFVGGVDGYYTTDAGESWIKRLDAYDSKQSGELYVHPDHHFADFLNNNTLLISHDGGLATINTSTSPFTQTDLTGTGLIITQIYHAAINPSDAANENMLLGLQDNDGFSKSPNTLDGQWVAAAAGDGTGVAINQNDPKIRFLGGTMGQLSKTTTAFKAGYDDQKVVIENDEEAPFVCEVLIHNQNPDHVFAGHSELKFSTDGGETFENVPAEFSTGPTEEVEQYGNRVAAVRRHNFSEEKATCLSYTSTFCSTNLMSLLDKEN